MFLKKLSHPIIVYIFKTLVNCIKCLLFFIGFIIVVLYFCYHYYYWYFKIDFLCALFMFLNLKKHLCKNKLHFCVFNTKPFVRYHFMICSVIFRDNYLIPTFSPIATYQSKLRKQNAPV